MINKTRPTTARHTSCRRAFGVRPSYKWQRVALVVCLLAVDAAMIYASLTLAYLVRLSSGLLAYAIPYEPEAYHLFAIVSIPVWLTVFAALGLYRIDNLLGGLAEYQGVFRGSVAGVIAIIVLSFFWRDSLPLSRGWLLLAWGLAFALVTGGRFVMRRVAYALRRRGFFTVRVLMVGANDQGIAMARQWSDTRRSGIAVIGFVDDFKPVGTAVIDGLKVIGRPTALEELVRETAAEEVIVVASAVAWETLEEILARPARRNGPITRLSPGFYETLATGVAVTTKSFVPLLTVSESRLTGTDRVLKRLLDLLLGLAWGIVALPAMAVIAMGLKGAAPGEPLLDRHTMSGLRGAPYGMWKFHLRSGLDKLPQLFNVVAGQMSLVGPRPRAPGADRGDSNEALNLQTMKPGVIGPWAIDAVWVSGDELKDGLYYVRNWTIWLDLQIIIQSLLRWFRLERNGRRDRQAEAGAMHEQAPVGQVETGHEHRASLGNL